MKMPIIAHSSTTTTTLPIDDPTLENDEAQHLMQVFFLNFN